MSPYYQALRKAEDQDTASPLTIASTREFALLDELGYVRREAQLEADMAYEDWRVLDTTEAYAVYRAAQDRADAAQDDLANMVAQLVG